MDEVAVQINVELNVEFIRRVILALRDANERLDGIGVGEIIYCLHQLDDTINANEVAE